MPDLPNPPTPPDDLPSFTGSGFFAGQPPLGLTTLLGRPVSAQVSIYWHSDAGHKTLVAQTTSAADGTWRVEGLNPALHYHIHGKKDLLEVALGPVRPAVEASGLEWTANMDIWDAERGRLRGTVTLSTGTAPFTAWENLNRYPRSTQAAQAYFRSVGRVMTVELFLDGWHEYDCTITVTDSAGLTLELPAQALYPEGFLDNLVPPWWAPVDDDDT